MKNHRAQKIQQEFNRNLLTHKQEEEEEDKALLGLLQHMLNFPYSGILRAYVLPKPQKPG